MGSLLSLVFIAVIALAGAAVQLARSREPRTLGHASEVFLVWVLVVWVGIGAVLAFLSHTLLADETARAIGWPTGNPFQSEVAVANLVVGVLGILCYWIRGEFCLAIRRCSGAHLSHCGQSELPSGQFGAALLLRHTAAFIAHRVGDHL